MPEQENVATIRSGYDAFTRGDIAHILGLLDADVEWHAPRTVPFSKGVHRGPDEVAGFFARMAKHVAEPSVETYEFLPAGDRVVVLLCFRGRGIETGIPFAAPEAHVWKLAGGKVVAERTYADTATIVQALGSMSRSRDDDAGRGLTKRLEKPVWIGWLACRTSAGATRRFAATLIVFESASRRRLHSRASLSHVTSARTSGLECAIRSSR